MLLINVECGLKIAQNQNKRHNTNVDVALTIFETLSNLSLVIFKFHKKKLIKETKNSRLALPGFLFSNLTLETNQ